MNEALSPNIGMHYVVNETLERSSDQIHRETCLWLDLDMTAQFYEDYALSHDEYPEENWALHLSQSFDRDELEITVCNEGFPVLGVEFDSDERARLLEILRERDELDAFGRLWPGGLS